MTKDIFARLRRDTSGATALEYALLASLIAIVLIGTLTYVGDELTDAFNNIGSKVSSAAITGNSGAGNATGTRN